MKTRYLAIGNHLNRRQFIQYASLFLGSSIVSACTQQKQTTTNTEKKLDKISFGTNWLAQAEHGGFYQAIATGIYQDYGLDVTNQRMVQLLGKSRTRE